MAIYFYRGRDEKGVLVEGEVESTNPSLVANHLMTTGIYPLTIEEKRINDKILKKRVKPIDILTFTRQFYIMVKSGIPISKALKSMEISNQNEYMKEIFKDIRQTLDNGYELYIALQKHPEFFSVFYINMVRIGDLTGRLEEVLLELYNFMEFEQEMKQSAKNAMRYPFFVIIAISIAFTIMMVFVIPAFSKIYDSFNAQLPWPTRMLIETSNFMVSYGIYLAILLGGSIFWFKNFIKSGVGKLWWDEFKFYFPVIGKILKKSILARFSKSFSLSLKSGIPLVQGLTVIAQVVDNLYIGKYIEEMKESVERGNTLYNSAKATNVFEPLVMEMISTGEESGELPAMMDEVSHLYDKEIEYELKTLNAQIEPIMLAFLGGLILIFALGIFLPMWDLASVVIKK